MPSKKLKPNQPCHCGSGKKYKKCCKVADDLSSTSRDPRDLASAVDATRSNDSYSGPPLRFDIGERVLAYVDYTWLPGRVVDLHYREPDWPDGRVSPYQILLDEGGTLIHAPFDGDKCIQKYDASKDDSRRASAGGKENKRKGKKQLKEEARMAEELREELKGKESFVIPERGNDEFVRDEFTRSGMLGAHRILCRNDQEHFPLMFEWADWKNLKIPEEVDEDSMLGLLQPLFHCVPQLRRKNSTLEKEYVEMFSNAPALELLPSLLHMCIDPEQLVSSDDGIHPSEFVWDCIWLLESLQSQADFQINGSLAKELLSIVCICTSKQNGEAIFLAHETIDPLFDKANESALTFLLDELRFPHPCRGHIATLVVRTIGGKPWVEFDPHIKTFCERVSAILVDPRSSGETNDCLFLNIDDLLKNRHWAENVLSLTLESLRHCQIHMKLDTTLIGGLEILLQTASQTIAAAKGYDDDMFLVKEIFDKDNRGIPQCFCPRHSRVVPQVVCANEHKNELEKTASSLLRDAATCMDIEQYDKVLDLTAKAIETILTSSSTGEQILWDNTHLYRSVHSLRGQAHLNLGEFEGALYCFCEVMGGDPTKKKSFCQRSSKSQCDACLGGIRALVHLGRAEAASDWHSCLVGMTPQGTDEFLTAQYLENAKAAASALVSNAPADSPVPAAAPLIDSKPAIEGISCPVRECSWKSVGDIAEGDDSVNTGTYAVPRLHIVLVWIRGRLLIWNYRESKIIQWLRRPSSEVCAEGLFHTSDMTSIFVLYSDKGVPFVILLDKLHRLKQGGACSAEVAMKTTLGMNSTKASTKSHSMIGNQTFDAWWSNVRGLSKTYGRIANFTGAQIKRTKGWNLAMVMDSSNLGILVFTGNNTIAPGVASGPFALLTGAASFVLKGEGNAHLRRIYELIFVDNEKADTLVSSAGDKSIKVWDVTSRSCKHTIHVPSTLVRTLACTATLLFGAADRHSRYDDGGKKKSDEIENHTFGSHCINVWDTQNGQHVATLRSKSGRRVESIITVPQRNIVLSGHSTGEVHAWRYDKVGHVVGFRILSALSDYSSWGISLHLHNDYVVVMGMTHLIMLSGLVQNEGDEEQSNLPLVGQSLNCGNCKLWKIGSSSKCPGCRKVWFCNKDCMKKVWRKHKKECQNHK